VRDKRLYRTHVSDMESGNLSIPSQVSSMRNKTSIAVLKDNEFVIRAGPSCTMG